MPTQEARDGMRNWLAEHQIHGQPDTILDALINLEIGLHTHKDTP